MSIFSAVNLWLNSTWGRNIFSNPSTTNGAIPSAQLLTSPYARRLLAAATAPSLSSSAVAPP